MAVALMTGHISMDHSQAASFKPTQIPRPELSAGETSKGWQYFLNRWKEYSQAANLTAPHITIQLLACLDPKLRRDVTMNATGPTPLREYTEPDLLAAIKAMAVQEENKRAARVTLSRMTQDRGETVRSFVARLQGQAEVCRFDRKCTGCETVNSQSEDRVADQLCVGLADPDIQADLLKEPDRNQTVEELVQFIMVRVTGKQSFTTMTTPPQASNSAIDDGADKGEALRSGYKRQQQHPPPKATPPKPNRPATPKWPPTTPTPHPNSKTACCFCGRQGHGTRARTAIRRTQCPAFGKTCQSCGRPNHTAQMCWQTTEQESAIQEVVSDMTEGTLPHQTWDQTSQTWAQRRSPPQPTLNVAISTHRADFQTQGHHSTKWDSTGVVVEVMQYHQYQVRMDSNGRTTTRNRQYLRRNTTPIPPPDHPLQRRLPHPQPPAPPRPTTQPPRQPLPGTPATPPSQPLPGTPAPPPSQPLPGTPPPPPSHPSPGTPAPPPSQPSPGIPAPPPSQPSPGTPASQHVAGPPEPPQLPMTHTTTQRQPTATPATTSSYAAAAGTPATRDNLPPLAPKKLAKIPPPPPKPTNSDQTLRRSTRTRKPRQF